MHKGTLAVACSYFAKLFRNSYAECETSTSKITLVKEAADAFPAFLDYVYYLRTDVEILTTDNATALYHIGQYFGLQSLTWEVSSSATRIY